MKKEKLNNSLYHNDRKNNIVVAASIIFAEKGYERTTLQDIATEIGITKATLYYYYNSKHQILFEIVIKSISNAISHMSQIAESPIATKEKINLAFQQHFKFYLTNHPGPSVMLHEKTNFLPLELEVIVKSKYREYISLWEKILREGVESGIIRSDLDVKMMRWAAIGMCNWAYKWAHSEGKLQFNQIATIFSKVFTEGVIKH